MLSYLLLPLPASSKTSSAVSSLGEVAEFAFQHQLSFSTLKVCLPVRKKMAQASVASKRIWLSQWKSPSMHPSLLIETFIEASPKKSKRRLKHICISCHQSNKGNIPHYLNATKHGQLCMFIIWYYICIQLSPYTYTHKHMYILSYEKDTHSSLNLFYIHVSLAIHVDNDIQKYAIHTYIISYHYYIQNSLCMQYISRSI